MTSEVGMKELKENAKMRERIRQLLIEYPEPWVIKNEKHEYDDGTTHFTHVQYFHKPEWAQGETICIEIANHITPDLAELLILLREWALKTT